MSEVWFWTGNFSYIADGVGQLFPNLNKFWVSYDNFNLGLKLLKRRNFKDMEKLFYLDVKFNDVETVAEDSLWDLPELQYFIVNNNKLKHFHKKTFVKSPKLKEVKANTNELKFLHRDLFVKNPLLHKLDFGNNKLTTIEPDFTKFIHLLSVDFHQNICIDKSSTDTSSLQKLQELLNANCVLSNVENLSRSA